MRREDARHEERLYYEEHHLATIACILYNVHRDPKKVKAAVPSDFMLSPPPPPPETLETDPEKIKAIFGGLV